MSPQSMVESEELRHILSMANYDEEAAFKAAFEESLEVQSQPQSQFFKGRISRQHISGFVSSGNTSSSGDSSNGGGIARQVSDGPKGNVAGMKSSGGLVNRPRKIGGNKGQMLIDPWLSAGTIVTAKESRPSANNRAQTTIGDNSGNVWDSQQREEDSRRTSMGRSRFDHEPMSLISTTASTLGTLRSETPTPNFASPKKPSAEVVEVLCSDQEDSEVDGSQMEASSAKPSINVISSSDEEPDLQIISPRRRRRHVREILDSSEDNDELTRDTGRGVLKMNVRKTANPRHPVADDTIPRSPSLEMTFTSTPNQSPGSTARMPWSITEGPNKDIVLSTPTSKQRIRQYNMVLDSEEELSESEKSLMHLSTGNQKTSVHAKHLDIPNIESAVDEQSRRSVSRYIVSDSEADVAAPDALPVGTNEVYTIQSTIGEHEDLQRDIFIIESQNFFGPRARSRVSPDRQTFRNSGLTKLTKPRPLVLNAPFEEEFSQSAIKEFTLGEPKDSEMEHKQLRETLMFTDETDELSPSPTPNPSSGWVIELNREKMKFEKNPFSNFPKFDRSSAPVRKDVIGSEPEDDRKAAYLPWGNLKENEAKRSRNQASDDVLREEEVDTEEDEPLEDSRLRRRSAQSNMASPPKKVRLSEIAPDNAAMESALKSAAAHARQQAEVKNFFGLERLETIETFSTPSDSQLTTARVNSGLAFGISQAEEIEDFSDDQRTQLSMHLPQERKTRRYSGLHLVSREHVEAQFKSPDAERAVEDVVEERAQEHQHRHRLAPSSLSMPPKKLEETQEHLDKELDQELEEELQLSLERRNIRDSSPTLSNNARDYGSISPTLSQEVMNKCPICHKMIPVQELNAHVDAELLAVDQQNKEDMERRDQEIAFALDECYQNQNVVVNAGSNARMSQAQPRPRPANARVLNSPKTSHQSNVVSLDTPTRRVGRLTLESPPSTPQIYEASTSGTSRLRKIGSGGSTDLSVELLGEPETIDLSELESLSSQSAFGIQPGQVFPDPAPSSADVYMPMRSSASSSRNREAAAAGRGSRSKEEPESGNFLAPFVAQDDFLDEEDDLEDFLEMPEPSSLMNRPSRPGGKATAAPTTTARSGMSVGRRSRGKTTSPAKKRAVKAAVNLVDSEDEQDVDGQDKITAFPASRTTAASKKGGKTKPTLLDDLLPTSARQRRQQLLKKSRGQRATLDDEDDIEVSRRHPIAEKLWNQEDDLFDSEQLDRRQVKGVGLGGVVGGIGAVPGSLGVSKLVQKSAVVIDTQDGSIPSSLRGDWVFGTDSSRQGSRLQDEGAGVDEGRVTPPSLDFDDPNYGLPSQDWWDNPCYSGERDRPRLGDVGSNFEDSRTKHTRIPTASSGSYRDDAGGINGQDDFGEGDEDNADGYTSPLDDFVDLRKRRNDPAMALYFAQFGGDTDLPLDMAAAEGSSRGRGRGTRRRGGAAITTASRKKGMSFGAGVGPMSTMWGVNDTDTASESGSGPVVVQAVLTAYGIPRRATPGTATAIVDGAEIAADRYGARNVSFGKHATTANGSMAVRSKPTVSVRGRRGGRGNSNGSSSSWRGRWSWRGHGR
ncbi:hypothetical protein EDD11_006103 [Mortierella claussenii]|nr:hypothetical protein EDD11_006103 [Mortierella claussenii]